MVLIALNSTKFYAQDFQVMAGYKSNENRTDFIFFLLKNIKDFVVADFRRGNLS